MFYDAVSKPFPLHKKYDLYEVKKIYPKNFKAVAVKAKRLPHADKTLNGPASVFMYHREQEHWFIIKGPTTKRYVKEI